jgi:uncharacterized metal-binding protein YceD (DUF177 family)
MTGPVSAEFPRPLHLDEIGIGGADLEIDANADERDLLALRLDLVSLDRLTATVHVDLMENDTVIHVTGILRADVTQSCVVTLEPMTTHIEGALECLFTTDGDTGTGGEIEITLSPDIEDPPEPIPGETIDLGEVVAAQLALEIDPFRKPLATHRIYG